jgi:hypothetical protein
VTAAPDACAELWERARAVAHSADEGTRHRGADCVLVALTEAVVSRRDPAHARIARALAEDGRIGEIAAQAYLVHARNSDDAYAVAAHPGGIIVPAAIVEGADGAAAGAALLTATVAGYEVACTLADVFLPAAAERGWRISSVVAPMAAAATLASLWQLDDDDAISALRIAAAAIGGALETVSGRGDDFRVQPALAAVPGVLAARAAVAGVAGTTGILEGPQGPFALVCGGPWPGWPARERPGIHGVAFKRYEGAMYAQAIFGALEQLPLLAGDIDVRLRVPTFAAGYSGRSAANDRAPSSLAGITADAVAALHPSARVTAFSVTADDTVGQLGAAVSVTLADSTSVAAHGDGDTSGWSSADVDALCRARLGDNRLVAAVRALDDGGRVDAVVEAWRDAV